MTQSLRGAEQPENRRVDAGTTRMVRARRLRLGRSSSLGGPAGAGVQTVAHLHASFELHHAPRGNLHASFELHHAPRGNLHASFELHQPESQLPVGPLLRARPSGGAAVSQPRTAPSQSAKLHF